MKNIVPVMNVEKSFSWEEGVLLRISGLDEENHGFSAEMGVPIGRSPEEQGEINFPGFSLFLGDEPLSNEAINGPW
jgi:hypothetical protein